MFVRVQACSRGPQVQVPGPSCLRRREAAFPRSAPEKTVGGKQAGRMRLGALATAHLVSPAASLPKTS